MNHVLSAKSAAELEQKWRGLGQSAARSNLPLSFCSLPEGSYARLVWEQGWHIERHRKYVAEIEKLSAALKPFANQLEDGIDEKDRDRDHLWESSAAMDLTVGDIRWAAEALGQMTDSGGGDG